MRKTLLFIIALLNLGLAQGVRADPLLFYDAATGIRGTARLDSNGNYQFVSTIPGFATGWSRIVATSNGGLLFYNASTGLGATARLDSNGNYQFVSTIPDSQQGQLTLSPPMREVCSFTTPQPVWVRPPGLTAPETTSSSEPSPDSPPQAGASLSGRATVPCSSTMQRPALARRRGLMQRELPLRRCDFRFCNGVDFTSLPRTREVFLFYNAAIGLGATARLDSAGNYQFVGAIPDSRDVGARIVGTSDGGLLFYKSSTGLGATARLDSGGTYQFVSTIPGFATGWTHIAGN